MKDLVLVQVLCKHCVFMTVSMSKLTNPSATVIYPITRGVKVTKVITFYGLFTDLVSGLRTPSAHTVIYTAR